MVLQMYITNTAFPLFISGVAVPVILLSSDGLRCFRYLRIRTIFKMKNIVTW